MWSSAPATAQAFCGKPLCLATSTHGPRFGTCFCLCSQIPGDKSLRPADASQVLSRASLCLKGLFQGAALFQGLALIHDPHFHVLRQGRYRDVCPTGVLKHFCSFPRPSAHLKPWLDALAQAEPSALGALSVGAALGFRHFPCAHPVSSPQVGGGTRVCPNGNHFVYRL